MKKLLLTASIVSIIGLSGCGGGETLEDVRNANQAQTPLARVLYDPAAGNLNTPNDLLMIPSGDLFDFTLDIPIADGENIPSNPLFAVNGADGWSTQHPFQLNIELPSGLDVDASSLSAGIKLYEATQALEGTSDTCQALAASVAAPGVPCELGAELTYGEDFIATYAEDSSGSITIIPTKLFKPGQGYLLVVTSDLKDNTGRAVHGSTTWESVRQDINTAPLSSASQLELQALVNTQVGILEAAAGMSRENIAYVSYFSTVSATNTVSTLKQLMIAPYAQALATAPETAAATLPNISADIPSFAPYAYDVLAELLLGENYASLSAIGLDNCAGLTAAVIDTSSPLNATATETFASVGAFCAAKRVTGTVDLPYYLNPENPLQDWWRSACTNGAMISVLRGSDNESIQGLFTALDAYVAGNADALTGLETFIGDNNAACIGATASSGSPLFDLDLSALAGIEDPRHVTKVAPIPVARGSNPDGTETLNVQFTVPDVTVASIIAANSGNTITAPVKPEAGWPIIIFQHGITGSKENALILSGLMSLQGFATVAIDHPLHGERAIIIDNEGEENDIFADASADVTAYMNLASLLTGRDNIRQSTVDTLGLRLALNAITDNSGELDLDTSNVYFVGMSLGAITGIGTVAQANTPLPEAITPTEEVASLLNGMFHIKAAVPNVPMVGIGGSLLESAGFSPLVKATVLSGAFPEFAALVAAAAAEQGSSFNISVFYTEYLADLTERQASGDPEISSAANAELAGNEAAFAQFTFAAQTVIDGGDPINHVSSLSATTPILLQLVVGGGNNDDGETALADQVTPVDTSFPLYGGRPIIALAGLTPISATATAEEGSTLRSAVLFHSGSHGSLLDTSPSAGTTTEMQSQIASFFKTNGTEITVNNTDVIQN
jgi:Pla-1/cef family extracellular lipase